MSTSRFHFGLLRFPCLMGIVNITPNSFSDGGAYLDTPAAIDHACLLASQGAQILDLGAEASSFFRPGVTPVDAAQQLHRLMPVLEGLTGRCPPGVYLSIDTRSAEVARHALQAGAHIINDISAGTADPQMLTTVAEHEASIILMHIGPTYPQNPEQDDSDILGAVGTFLHQRVAAARAAGIPEAQIALDPGVGFGKTPADNWTLALRCQTLAAPTSPLGPHHPLPIVLGASRKRFLEYPPPADLAPNWTPLLQSLENPQREQSLTVHPRDAASAAATALAARQGVRIHRVHQVTLAAQALTM